VRKKGLLNFNLFICVRVFSSQNREKAIYLTGAYTRDMFNMKPQKPETGGPNAQRI
jgi:hypothetical protein